MRGSPRYNEPGKPVAHIRASARVRTDRFRSLCTRVLHYASRALHFPSSSFRAAAAAAAAAAAVAAAAAAAPAPAAVAVAAAVYSRI